MLNSEEFCALIVVGSMSSSFSSSYTDSQDGTDVEKTAVCIRNVANFSTMKPAYLIEKPVFHPELLQLAIPLASPKLEALFEKIARLDAKDRRTSGKTFKHMIFTDVHNSQYGVKLLASAFAAKGFVPAFQATGPGFSVKPVDQLRATENSNFGVLCSKKFMDRNMSTRFRKALMDVYNTRPDNTHGEQIRFMILDQGYKEGIDLFDVKYIHLFEPLTVRADEKQAIGRGTRFCGQKGLQFHPRFGWTLYVFRYDVRIPDASSLAPNARTLSELYLQYSNIDVRRVTFAAELEQASQDAAVDHALTAPVHEFKMATPPPALSGGAKLNPTPPYRIMNYGSMGNYIRNHFMRFKYPAAKLENLCEETRGGAHQLITFTPTQNFIRHYFQPSSAYKGILLHHATGTGKCHAKDTPILMYDGSIKMVQDVKVGDLLMGDDSTPRKVLSLASDQDDMYDIIPSKGDKYTVNSEHILCLRPTRHGVHQVQNRHSVSYVANFINKNTGKVTSKTFATKEEGVAFLDEVHADKSYVCEISVKDFLKLSKTSRKNLKGYRVGVEFRARKVSFDPYLIGYWLGDGVNREPKISTGDQEILDYFCKSLKQYDLSLVQQNKYDYRISNKSHSIKPYTYGSNTMMNCLREYNLLKNKHIPHEYKINSRDTRLQVLAGLIDSDGYYDDKGKGYEIIQKNKLLATDIVFLCRSLGFAAYMSECKKSCIYNGEKREGTYQRIYISGDGLEHIPSKLVRKTAKKRIINKNALVTGIEVKHVGKGTYYGFTLDGNNRYLLGDFTVTHNTCTAIATATQGFEKEGYTIMWVTRHTLKSDIWKNMFKQVCSMQLRKDIRSGKLKGFPEHVSGPMKYMSPQWMEPMSYKQFTNMLLKKNRFYEEIVERNGSTDPLRKTLIIIDEAHKLYAPSAPKSEKPDMEVFEKMIQNSYKKSGKNSCRIMLMTATPFTEDGMEMIKLLNLLKETRDHMPVEFDEFSASFLDKDGLFTKQGLSKFRNEVSGYISYLNRSQDGRNFAHPVVEDVLVDITLAPNEDEPKIKRKSHSESELADLKKTLAEKKKELAVVVKKAKESKRDCVASTRAKKKECKEQAKNEYQEELVNAKELYQQAVEECNEEPRAKRASCKANAKEVWNSNKVEAKTEYQARQKGCDEEAQVNCDTAGETAEQIDGRKLEIEMLATRKQEITESATVKKEKAKKLMEQVRELRPLVKELNQRRKTLASELGKAKAEIGKISDDVEKKAGMKLLREGLGAEYKAADAAYKNMRAKMNHGMNERKVMRLQEGKAKLGDLSQETALKKRCNV